MNTIHFPELPRYLSIEKLVENNSVKVKVHSSIHVNRTVLLPMEWSIGYTITKADSFRSEILSHIVKRYNLKLVPARYE